VSFQTSRWPMVAIGDAIASVKPGFASGERCDDGVIQFRMNNVDRAGNISWDAVTKVPADSKKIASYGVKLGDVLFNQTNSRDLVGKTAFFPGHPAPVVFSNHFLRLRPRSERLDGAYLSRYLQALYLTGYFGKKCNAWVNQATFGKDDLLALQMPLPPLDEQRSIAAILDKADAIRRKRRQALALADDFLRSAFLAAIAGAEDNRSVRLAEITTRITDGTHLTPKFVSSGVPFIFVRNFGNGKIDFTTDKYITDDEYAELYRRCPVETGDVLYTTVGATYGQAAAVGEFTRFAFQRHVAHIKPDRKLVIPEFLEGIMQLPLVKRQADRRARGAAQPTVNLSDIREFEVPLLSLETQQVLVGVASKGKAYKAAQARLLAEEALFFASLSQRAFRGEL